VKPKDPEFPNRGKTVPALIRATGRKLEFTTGYSGRKGQWSLSSLESDRIGLRICRWRWPKLAFQTRVLGGVREQPIQL